MRHFVHNHASYKGDSVVSEEIAYDLLMACQRIGNGEESCPLMHGPFKIDR